MPNNVLNQLKSLRDGVAEDLRKDPRYQTLQSLDKSIAEITNVLAAAGLLPPGKPPSSLSARLSGLGPSPDLLTEHQAPQQQIAAPPEPATHEPASGGLVAGEPTPAGPAATETPPGFTETPPGFKDGTVSPPQQTVPHDSASSAQPASGVGAGLAAGAASADLFPERTEPRLAVPPEPGAPEARDPADYPAGAAPEHGEAEPAQVAEPAEVMEPIQTMGPAGLAGAEDAWMAEPVKAMEPAEVMEPAQTMEPAGLAGAEDAWEDEAYPVDPELISGEAAVPDAEHGLQIQAASDAMQAHPVEAHPVEAHPVEVHAVEAHLADAEAHAPEVEAPQAEERAPPAEEPASEAFAAGAADKEIFADPAAAPEGKASGYLPMAARAGAPQYAPSIAVKFGKLPNKVDLRPMMTPVGDQGEVNSCVADAVASSYECWIKKAAKKDHPVSRLFVYYNARWRDGAQRGDAGSVIQFALEGLQKFGACAEAAWPFDPRLVTEKPGAQAYQDGALYRTHDMAQVPLKLETWKQALAEGKPIVFGIALFDTFGECGERGGVVPMPAPEDLARGKHGGHCLCAVGYSESEKVFVVRNSWGAAFGDAGYCYMPYNYVLNPKFNDGDCWVFVPKVPSQPPRESWQDDAAPLVDAGRGADFPIQPYRIEDYADVPVDLFEHVRQPWNAAEPAGYAEYAVAVGKNLFAERDADDLRTAPAGEPSHPTPGAGEVAHHAEGSEDAHPAREDAGLA